jgi:hypothetical protein
MTSLDMAFGAMSFYSSPNDVRIHGSLEDGLASLERIFNAAMRHLADEAASGDCDREVLADSIRAAWAWRGEVRRWMRTRLP